MADLLNYTPPAHMDARALIERAATQLRAWHAKYGEHQPQWLPPAGDVRWLEDAAAFLAVHQWRQPAFVAGPGFPVSGVSTWRTGLSGALVRVCEVSDAECSRGCNVGPCVKRAADLAGVTPCDAGQTTEVQFQRRQGTNDGTGTLIDGLRWGEWHVCTLRDVERIDGLRSWQWRKITIPAHGVQGCSALGGRCEWPLRCEDLGRCAYGVAGSEHQVKE